MRGTPAPDEYYDNLSGWPGASDYSDFLEDDAEADPEANYVHKPCGTEKYIEGAHKVSEYAWCEEAESVVRFTRID